MATTTTNFGLTKPALTDPANITAMNYNWDKLDTEVFALKNNKQPVHYYYEPSNLGCTVSSTPTEIWNAMPDHSVFVYPSTSLTNTAWNFPTGLGVVRIEKYAINRGYIEYFGKDKTARDHRMYLDASTGNPSGTWYSPYTTATEMNPPFIELTPSTAADNGGFIDFHYAGSTKDYTARIIETKEGRLEVTAPEGFVVSGNLRTNKEIKIPDGTNSGQGTRIYSSDGIGLGYLVNPEDTNSARTGLKIGVPSIDLNALARVFISTETSANAKWYNLFGEHNKPSGSYIGNGSAKTVTIGGTGKVLYVNGEGYSVLVMAYGAIYMKNVETTVTAIKYSDAHFTDGVLTLSASNNILNKSASVYNYQVL